MPPPCNGGGVHGWMDECKAQALVHSLALRLVRCIAASHIDGYFCWFSVTPTVLWAIPPTSISGPSWLLF